MTATRPPFDRHRRDHRRGAILLVVLALLALFAVIGLSFVLYAESEATACRIYREAVSSRDAQRPDAVRASAEAVAALVYGTGNPLGAFDGVELARLLYGYDPTGTNAVPYNGVGLTHELLQLPFGPNPGDVLTMNRAEVVNYGLAQLHPNGPYFRVDPEHTQGNGQVRQGPAALDDTVLSGHVFVGKNAPYTYPERNNLLVAAVDPNTGRVIVPSGHRPTLFGSLPPFDPANPAAPANFNWYSARGRFRTLRPRPIDQVPASKLLGAGGLIARLNAGGVPWPVPDNLTQAQMQTVHTEVAKETQFPYPPKNADGTTTGDVQNQRFTAGVQHADSYWADPRLPSQAWSRVATQKVAPLVSVLVVPLDGRLDLNVAGNIRGGGGAHTSNQGFGPHEGNLQAVLRGAGSAAALVSDRYAVAGGGLTPAVNGATAPFTRAPSAVAVGQVDTTQASRLDRLTHAVAAVGVTGKPFAAAGDTPPSYSPTDWAGAAPLNWLNVPGANGHPVLASSPAIATGLLDPANHPTLWNPFQRAGFGTADPTTSPFRQAGTPPPAGAYDVPPAGFVPAQVPVPHSFPLTDLLLFGGRYSGRAYDFQTRTFLANDFRSTETRATGTNQAPPARPQYQREFLGNGTAFLGSLGAGPNSPGNLTRGLVTPFSSSFAKPGLGFNFANGTDQVLALNPAVSGVPQLYQPAGGATPTVVQSPLFSVTGALGGDRAGDNRGATLKAQNLRAALGGVNLNRPLADYRGSNTGGSLAVTLNPAGPPLVPPGGGPPQPAAAVIPLLESAAWNDRQELAADIFLRLCIATGARIAFDPNIPAENTYIPAGARLPYSDNVTRLQTDNGVTRQFRGAYVLPQPTGYDTTTQRTTYALFLNPAQDNGGNLVNGTQVAVSKEEYDALRYLAQLAANIVDQIDGDDVSTAFVWNPAPQTTTPGSATTPPTVVPLPPAGYGPTTQLPPSLIPATVTSRTENTGPAPWPTSLNAARLAGPPTFAFAEERAVFGTEKPRLVLNEAYAEVANDVSNRAGNQATRPFRVRFWLELLNPNGTEQPGTTLAGPDYTTPPGPGNGGVPLAQGTTPVYRVQVFDKGTPVLQQLGRPQNVLGVVDADDTVAPITASAIGTAATERDRKSRLICDLAGAGITAPTDTTASATQVEPNQGQPAAAPGTARHGFAVIGPAVKKATHEDARAFTPDETGTNPFSQAILKAENTGTSPTASELDALDYLVAPKKASEITAQTVDPLNADPNRHVVLLQRLANPYLGFDTVANPYITVDVVSQVQVFDGIRVGNDSANNPDTNNSQDSQNPDRRSSLGRVQPFAGYQDDVPASGTPQYQYPAATVAAPTLALRQTGTIAGSQQKLTLFRHNYQATAPAAATTPVAGGETLLAPFRWLTQFDRRLINPTELAQVTAGPPHQLTRRFALPVATTSGQAASGEAVAFHRHTLGAPQVNDGMGMVVTSPPSPPNFPPIAAGQPGALAAADSPLFRALDVLGVKPWTHAVPHAGRVPGRVNINMLWDEDPVTRRSRVFDAILDRQAGNTFSEDDRTRIWQALKATRSPNWAASGTPLLPGTAYAPAVGVTADEATPAGGSLVVTNPPLPPAGGPTPLADVRLDQPVKGFGTARFRRPAGALGGAHRLAESGLKDTLLRPRTFTQIPAAGNNPGVTAGDNLPLFSLTDATRGSSPTAAHPYLHDEPLRKVLNSLTTTSDTYLVLVTVGFFEVVEESDPSVVPAVRVLGPEVFADAPGDLRGQFVAVVDRTGLATDRPEPGPQRQTDAQPWTVELQTPLTAGSPNSPAEMIGLGVPRGTWNGVEPPPASAELKFHDGAVRPPLASNTTNYPADPSQDAGGGFWRIVPQFRRTGTGTIDPTGPMTLQVSGTYEGQTIVLRAVYNPTTLQSTSDTPFFVGSGDKLERVEPYIVGDPTAPANRWSFNPDTGAVRVNIRPATGPSLEYPTGIRVGGAGTFAFAHEGGTAVSNVVFRHPGPQNPPRDLKPGKFDPVVRLLAELK